MTKDKLRIIGLYVLGFAGVGMFVMSGVVYFTW